jgi:hypothetical protein
MAVSSASSYIDGDNFGRGDSHLYLLPLPCLPTSFLAAFEVYEHLHTCTHPQERLHETQAYVCTLVKACVNGCECVYLMPMIYLFQPLLSFLFNPFHGEMFDHEPCMHEIGMIKYTLLVRPNAVHSFRKITRCKKVITIPNQQRCRNPKNHFGSLHKQ